jgi:iron complex transport system ATP-binding protein
VILHVQNLTVSYDTTEILRDISFTTAPGEWMGILGPNGSGKTTLVRALLKLLPKQSGEVHFTSSPHSGDLAGHSKKQLARLVAVVPQEVELGLEFTALQVVLLGRIPYLNGFSFESEADLQAAQEALRLTRTEALAHRPFCRLSGGEQQRVLLAKALAQDAPFLFLDEPTSHLDINYQIEMLELVRQLRGEKAVTVLSVLHDLNLAAAYCDRILALKEGRIAALGPPSEVLTPELISQVFAAQVSVARNPLTGFPSFLAAPSARPPLSPERQLVPVHVIGGGGTAGPYLSKLASAGFQVTCGVLNQGDSDLAACSALGISATINPPFSPIAEESWNQVIGQIAAARAVVVTDFPVGHGNLANLLAAEKAGQMGHLLILINPVGILQRDFTDGLASQIFGRLVRLAKLKAETPDAVVKFLRNP